MDLGDAVEDYMEDHDVIAWSCFRSISAPVCLTSWVAEKVVPIAGNRGF